MNKDEIKAFLDKDKIIDIVEHLGSASPKIDNKGSLKFQTICHGGSSFKMYYYDESKDFHCFTHCQENFDIYGLVMKVMNINFPQAIRYVAEYFNLLYDTAKQKPKGFVSTPKYTDDWDVIERYSRIYDRINSQPIVKESEFYNDSILELFDESYLQLWIDEGISVETMQKYEIRYNKSNSEVIIPHRNIDGKLIGIRSRTYDEKKIENGFKYMPTMIQGEFYTHEVATNLYGLHINREYIMKLRKVMLVEGEKSVEKCDTYYGKNNFTLALSGSSLSRDQLHILLAMNVREVILALDKPSEEDWNDPKLKKKYMDNILKIGYMLSPYFTVNVLWDDEKLLDFKDSPVDKGKEVLEKLLESKQEITSKEEEE